MNIDAVPFASKHAHHPQVGILSAEDLQPSEDADPPLELGTSARRLCSSDVRSGAALKREAAFGRRLVTIADFRLSRIRAS